MTEKQSRTRIVVGVDGSEGSIEALRWAGRQARATGAPISVIAAWDLPMYFGYAPAMDDIDWAASARQGLDQAVEKAAIDEDIILSRHVVRGHAGTVLVDAGRDAELLVVGSRGHGAVAGMLLGSISQYCTQHASCPVVVVRPHSHHED